MMDNIQGEKSPTSNKMSFIMNELQSLWNEVLEDELVKLIIQKIENKKEKAK